MISASIVVRAQFYDLDPMQVVWHGNYARFLEQARCALLDKIGYNYVEMSDTGYVWPIVDMRIKYVRSVRFGQEILVEAKLVEYENRLKIAYVIRDGASGEVVTRAETVQVAVAMDTQEMQFESPEHLKRKVEALL